MKALLEADGWEVTHDPLFVKTALATVEIDLGAEKVLGAEKGGNKIAVEVKSFIGHSKLQDLYKALGQYGYYLPALRRQEPDRKLIIFILIKLQLRG
ncbi:MAG: element excision factor XisH family protein [Bacteroidota bacterium]